MSALGTAVGIILGRVRGRRLARTIAARQPTATPVAVYFADGPSSLYQLRRWYQTLEALNRTVFRTPLSSRRVIPALCVASVVAGLIGGFGFTHAEQDRKSVV